VEIDDALVYALLPRAVTPARIGHDGEVQEWDVSEARLDVNMDYFIAMPVDGHCEWLRVECDDRFYQSLITVDDGGWNSSISPCGGRGRYAPIQDGIV